MEVEEFDMANAFKVQLCNIGGPHNWKVCPFYHHGERARRRDPTKYSYQPIHCRDYHWPHKRCPRANACRYSHGFWEVGYHPDRFRTQPCWNGPGCRRVFCSFVHTGDAQHCPPHQDRIIRGPRNNRNTNDYYASSSSAAVAPPDMNSVVIRRPSFIPSAIQRANDDDQASPNSPAAHSTAGFI